MLLTDLLHGNTHTNTGSQKKVYREARKRHPERWSKQLRDWELIQAVYLNPEKEAA
ncbi:hypothetical protein ACT3MA_24375 [Escherichia coli]